VDSSFEVVVFAPVVEYLVVGAALVNGEFRQRFLLEEVDLDWEIAAQVELDEEYHSRATEGLGIGIELILAEKYSLEKYSLGSSKFPLLTYLDGSLATFVIKLNYMLSVVAKEDRGSGLLRKMREIGERAVSAYYQLLKEGNVVACPKASSRSDFLEFLKTNGDFEHLLKEVQRNAPFSLKIEYFILDELLKVGEYVKVPIRKSKYNLPLNDQNKAQEIFNLVNEAMVYYMKGVSKKVYKFEVVGKFDPSWAFPFTVGQEFFPLFRVDEWAKNHLKLLKSRGYPDADFYREKLGR